MIFLLILIVVLLGLIAILLAGYLRGIEKELSTIRQFLQVGSSYEGVSAPAQAAAFLQNISTHVSNIRDRDGAR